MQRAVRLHLQVARAQLIWRHWCPVQRFSLFCLTYHPVTTHCVKGRQCHKPYLGSNYFFTDSIFASRRPKRKGEAESERRDGPPACQCLITNRKGVPGVLFYFFLPSLAGTHHAPSSDALHNHVHATGRTPQLHRRGCMAHPEDTENKKKMGEREKI